MIINTENSVEIAHFFHPGLPATEWKKLLKHGSLGWVLADNKNVWNSVLEKCTLTPLKLFTPKLYNFKSFLNHLWIITENHWIFWEILKAPSDQAQRSPGLVTDVFCSQTNLRGPRAQCDSQNPMYQLETENSIKNHCNFCMQTITAKLQLLPEPRWTSRSVLNFSIEVRFQSFCYKIARYI